MIPLRMPYPEEITDRIAWEGYMNLKNEFEEKESVTVLMESRSHNEQFARSVSAMFVSRLDPTIEEIDDVKTAVSEAVTNAVIHGYEGGDGIIEMRMTLEGNTATIAVKDEGVGIEDIKKAMEPMYTSKPSRERSGMGFSFMEAFMDSVEVISSPGKGTEVIMKKIFGQTGKYE